MGAMKIAMISDALSRGGAAIAASRLAVGLGVAGHNVIRLAAHGQDEVQHNISVQMVEVRHGIGSRVARRIIPDRYKRAIDTSEVIKAIRKELHKCAPDVVNIHNIHGAAWGVEIVEACEQYAPTVWTLHDMWSFTGRCAYRYDCQRLYTGCNHECPTASEYPALEPSLIHRGWAKRAEVLRRASRLVGVTPSRWLAEEAKRGIWGDREVAVIPYGLPLEVYRPVPKDIARQALSLPDDRPIVLIAAENVNERRKGGHLLRSMIQGWAGQPIVLAVFGAPLEVNRHSSVEIINLGRIDYDRAKALAYSAADVFLHPAVVDNLPNVLLESLACGTPAVGFAIGGVPEIIRSQCTGWIANEVSGEGLATALEGAIREGMENGDLRRKCREVAEAEYGCSLQAHRYSQLFESVLAKRPVAEVGGNASK